MIPSAARPSAPSPKRVPCSPAYGIPSEPKIVSNEADQRSTDSQTIPISWGGVPALTSPRTSAATSSTVPRMPAPSRKRSAPSSGGPGSGWSRKSWLSMCSRAGGTPRSRTRGSSSIAPLASRARSATVRSSAENTTRPGSYGIETTTSVRADRPSSSAHSAPVRSSKPYAKTGSSCQVVKSDSSRSAACRLRRSRSQSPRRSSSSL